MPADPARLRHDAARLAELTEAQRVTLERDVRRAASRQRLLLQRDPRADPQAPDRARYRLVDARDGTPVTGEGYPLTLAQAVDRLLGEA
jgi:hypothetical protein